MNADTIKALGTMGIGSILAIGLIFVMYKQMELEAERNTFMHDLMLRQTAALEVLARTYSGN